jgi:SAM-dependent methyltransferase
VKGSRTHYSYTVYADSEHAERFDHLRFGGPIGAIVAEGQEQTIVDGLGPLAGRTVLDVGTGTGRAALALARRGARATGVDASAEMLNVAARRAAAEAVAVRFFRADAHHLPFADRTFDAVICLRVLMHTPDWRRSLREVTRVSRRSVVIDYPRRRSFAALQAGWRRLSFVLGAKVQPYRVFSDREIHDELERSGFRVGRVHCQFVLPIAIHKQIGSSAFTNRIEKLLASAGLLSRFGSPVTVVAERCAS